MPLTILFHIIIGALVATIGLIFINWIVFWIGVSIAVYIPIGVSAIFYGALFEDVVVKLGLYFEFCVEWICNKIEK